jgi:hypothetical protein
MWPPGNRASAGLAAHARRLCVIVALVTVAPEASTAAGRPFRSTSTASGQQSQQSAELPPECLVCHGSDLITQQKLSRAAWSRELDKMVRWGAAVPPNERERLLDSLAARFAPARGGSHATSSKQVEDAPGVFTRSCLMCHERDLIAQQRLTRSGWAREVDKMIRWGAPVSEADKSGLVDFLAEQYPVR